MLVCYRARPRNLITRTTKKMKWYSIVNKMDEKKRPCAEITIADVIGWDVTFSAFLADLKACGEYESVSLIISSPGGSVLTALSIHNYLMTVRAQGKAVRAEVAGIAASAATIILCAAERVSMYKEAFVMTHQASMFAGGTSDDMQEAAELLAKMDNTIAGVYAKKTGKSVEDMKALIGKADYWMDGAEAKSMGFVDELLEDAPEDRMSASLCVSKFEGYLTCKPPVANASPESEPPAPEPESAPQPSPGDVVGVKVEDFKKIQARLTEYDAKNTALEAKIVALEQDKKNFDEAVTGKVTAALAELGVAASSLPPSQENVAMTADEFKAQYDVIQDPVSRSEFFNTHYDQFSGNK